MIPWPRPTVFAQREQHLTSMCLEIADWTHEDCAADFCRCDCHKAATS